MASITCKELSGGQSDCTVSLSGNTAEELKASLMAHAQEAHADKAASMTPEMMNQVMEKVESLF